MSFKKKAVIKSFRNRRPNQNSRLYIQYISECRKKATSSIQSFNVPSRMNKENGKGKLRLYCLKDTACKTRALEDSISSVYCN